MPQGIVVLLQGENRDIVADTLCDRIREQGGCCEKITTTIGDRTEYYFENIGEGLILVVAMDLAEPKRDFIRATISPHDTPDFAAEKIVDLLASRGLIALDSGDYTVEEEETVRKRLADLGYIE